MSEGHVTSQLPQYLCHKKVWALKIAGVEIVNHENKPDVGAVITPAERGYAPFEVSRDYVRKHNPIIGGFFVVYEDGYQSFSPEKAFVDGYTPINHDSKPAYRVVESVVGCGNCGAGKMWDVEGPDGMATGTTYGDKETAEEIAELLSEAYGQGQQSVTPAKRSLNAGEWNAADYELASRTHDVADTITRRLAEKVVKMVYFRYLTSNSELDTPEKEIIDDVIALTMGEKDCEPLGINSEGECENEFVEQQIFGLLRLPKPAELVPFFDFLQPADGPVVEGMEEAEVKYAEHQDEYVTLRTLPSNGPERKVLSRWSLMPGQREAVARGADVYLELMTFGHPLQPIRMGIGYKPNPAFIMNLIWPDQSAQPNRKLTPQERMDNFKETFLNAYRRTETVRERADGPPYDGNPCPMCPQNVRNLSATVHNLAWRLEDYSIHGGSGCKVMEKFQSMQDAVSSIAASEQWPHELTDLYFAACKASKCETVEELLKFKDSLKAVSNAVRPLSDAHFADRKHSHGDAPSLGRPIDELKFKDGSTYGERKENILGQNAPAKPPDEK